MKLKVGILIMVLISCSPKEAIEEVKLISEYKIKEHHRISKTEYSYNKKDSLDSDSKTFKSYDSKNRLINENNSIFFNYNKLGKVEEEISIYRRDRIVKVNTTKYVYDKNHNLKHKIRLLEPLDTILTNEYNSKGQLTKSDKGFETVLFEYEVDELIKKTTIKKGIESRISNFTYDSIGRLALDNWVFSSENRMKTKFTYDINNRLITEIDSSLNSESNPKSYVEFKTEYRYNGLDSLIEIRKSGRVLSETDFKYRGKTIITYK